MKEEESRREAIVAQPRDRRAWAHRAGHSSPAECAFSNLARSFCELRLEFLAARLGGGYQPLFIAKMRNQCVQRLDVVAAEQVGHFGRAIGS